MAKCICQNCTNPLLAWDGGKPEIVLAEVDADCGGEPAKLLPVHVVTLVLFIVKLRFLRHLSHPLWGRKCKDLLDTALLQNTRHSIYWKLLEISSKEVTNSPPESDYSPSITDEYFPTNINENLNSRSERLSSWKSQK